MEKGLNEDEVFKYKIPLVKEAEPEERRMSDWSDCAPSVNSSVDIQVLQVLMLYIRIMLHCQKNMPSSLT